MELENVGLKGSPLSWLVFNVTKSPLRPLEASGPSLNQQGHCRPFAQEKDHKTPATSMSTGDRPPTNNKLISLFAG